MFVYNVKFDFTINLMLDHLSNLERDLLCNGFQLMSDEYGFEPCVMGNRI